MSTAVSNLVGVMLAVAITLAIGAAASVVVMHYVTINTQNMQVTVQSTGLIKSADTTIFSITIKNSGTVALNALAATINGDTITSFDYGGSPISSLNPLPAGASTSYESSTLSGTFAVGLNYLVHITATGTTGGTYAADENVLCMGA